MPASEESDMRYLLALLAFAMMFPSPECHAADTLSLKAAGHDSRIDLKWQPSREPGFVGFNVYRSADPTGPFTRLNDRPDKVHVYSDFIGENEKTYFYRVGKVVRDEAWQTVESFSDIASAATFEMTDEQLLTSVQEATFRYFWDHAHPVSGLAYERARTSRYPAGGRWRACTTGGTGFGLIAIMVGSERKFVTREEAAQRVLTIVTFLQEKAERFHGAWSHWLNGETGRVIPFPVGSYDNGADLVETSFLMQGMLTVRRYFDRDCEVESEIRRRITQLWHEVEWDFFLQHKDSRRLYWHWSPTHGWKINLAIVGHNECMITYLLAIASPTHPIPAECYYKGWASNPRYGNGESYYGYKQWVGRPLGGPLFFTHYSFLGFDPRGKSDRYCNYFENHRNTTLINRAYCIENPKGHKGYGENTWGLTASDIYRGYRANAPGNDDGTIAPTAAISAMPYAPEESIAAMKHLYHTYGDQLWGEFGFHDAFNLNHNWFAESYLAIDQGPIVCMIENYRTGLCWRMFMSNPEIAPMLRKIGWTIDSDR